MSLTNEDKQWFGELLDGRFDAFEKKIDAKLDGRFDAFEKKMDAKLDGRFDAFEKKIDAKLDERFDVSENRMTEVMRDMQSELLRGFATFAESYAIRLNKVEANQFDMDKVLSGRVQILEGRLHQIEMRLFGELGPGAKAS